MNINFLYLIATQRIMPTVFDLYKQGDHGLDIIFRAFSDEIDKLARSAYQERYEPYSNLYPDRKETFAHLVLSHSFTAFYEGSELWKYLSKDGGLERQRPLYDLFCKVNDVPED